MSHTPSMASKAHRIEVRNLTKKYGENYAVNQANFAVEPGSMTGFLGANGAGKTTTMRMIMGLLEPNSGEVLYDGVPMTATDRISFGYMPEERGLYPKQGILNQLVYLGQLRGISAANARAQATKYLTELGLGDRLKDKLESLSLGNQQRVQIVASILHAPSTLILDEPFSGLDPKAVDTMVSMINDLRKEGVPVLFSSHQLDLVDRLCDRVVIISEGEIKASGRAQDLREEGPLRFRYTAGQDAGWLREVAGVQVLDLSGATALLEINQPDQLEQIRARILREGIERELHEFSRVLPTLGDIYRKVTNQ